MPAFEPRRAGAGIIDPDYSFLISTDQLSFSTLQAYEK
jgi:hypothetical protein